MRHNEVEQAVLKELKQMLGKTIKAVRTDDNRGYISMRKLADAIHIPVSNLKYIEDGINAPSPEVYNAIIENLSVTDAERKEMDLLYSEIRGTPPPDVCKIVCTNFELNDALRLIGDEVLTTEQVAEITALISSYKQAKKEGAATHG